MRNRLPLVLAACSWLAAVPASAADPIFDQGRLHEVRLVMDPSDWVALRQNFRSNDYYSANASLDGEVVQQIGVRSRGKGSRSGEKPGLKLDFNKNVSGQEFHGYKSIELLNIVQDQSMLREALSLAVFGAMGVPATQIGFARLTVNDEYWGVYNIKEDISKPFLGNNLGDKEGNLYKYEYADVWGFSTRGGGDAGAYIPLPFEPKTNEKTYDPAALVGFIKAINDSPEASITSAVSGFIDVNQFLTYIAVENAVAESDGMLGYAGMNNFFMYQFAGQNKFIVLPWDKNNSFNAPEWPLFIRVDDNVLAKKLMANPTHRQFYVDQVKRAVDSYVNTAYLGPKLEALYTQIREAVIADTKKPYSTNDFEIAVGGLRGIIDARRGDVAKQAP
jgi:spore coat protein CotH